MLGFLLVVFSALSFTRALQRVYERSWALQKRGYRGTPSGLAWLAALILWVTVFGGIRSWLEDLGGPILAVVVATGFALVLSAAIGAVLGDGSARASLAAGGARGSTRSAPRR